MSGSSQMTFGDPLLPLVTMREMRVGLVVALVGGDEEIPELERTSSNGVTHELHDGHPGVVSDCSMPDHVLVAWEGLEHEGISTAIGFGATEHSGLTSRPRCRNPRRPVDEPRPAKPCRSRVSAPAIICVLALGACSFGDATDCGSSMASSSEPTPAPPSRTTATPQRSARGSSISGRPMTGPTSACP